MRRLGATTRRGPLKLTLASTTTTTWNTGVALDYGHRGTQPFKCVVMLRAGPGSKPSGRAQKAQAEAHLNVEPEPSYRAEVR